MCTLLSILVHACLWKDSENLNVPEKVVYELDNVGPLFEEFSNKYDKKYDAEELKYRHKVFADNLMKINKWNREQPDAAFGIGPFTDLTFEEFTNNYAGCLGNFSNENAVEYEATGMAPESLDWRQSNIVTRVKNQQRCGSCYVFSAIGAIESQHAKRYGQLIELSEQQGLDCGSRGCNGGLPHETMQELARTGCMRESDYPYEAQKRQCRAVQSKVVVRVTGGSQLSVRSEDDLKDAVASVGPLSIGIQTNPELQHFRGGIFNPKTCNSDGHALLLVGYGTEGGTPYWLIKNSWGQQWNESGYLRMIRGRRACNIGSYVAQATVA